MRSRPSRICERQKNEGQAYYNDVVPRAQGAASRLTEEAQGYRQSVLANAEGEASRFKQVLAEYDKAPQVTRERMYLETVQQMLSSTSKILLEAKSGSNLLYLPLDKIMQMIGGRAAGDRRQRQRIRSRHWSNRRRIRIRRRARATRCAPATERPGHEQSHRNRARRRGRRSRAREHVAVHR